MRISTLFLITLIITVPTMIGFQCATAEMTSGKMYVQRQDWANAERSFEQEVTKQPDNSEAWYWLGRVRHELKNYKGMNEAFTRSVALSKEFEREIKNVRLATWGQLFNSGVEKYLQAKSSEGARASTLYRQASEDFSTAITINPDSGSTYTNLGLCYLGLGDFENAIKNFKIAFRKDKDLELALSIAGLYMERSQYNEALAILEEAQRFYPNDPNLVGSILDAQAVSGNVESAMTNFREAVRKNPKNKLYRYNYGVLLLKAGLHKYAVEQFEAAVALDEYFEDAMYNLGIAYLQWGAELRSAAEGELRANKSDKLDRSYEQYFRRGKSVLERLRDLKPNDGDVWEALGQAYANLDMSRDASNAFAEADKLRSSSQTTSQEIKSAPQHSSSDIRKEDRSTVGRERQPESAVLFTYEEDIDYDIPKSRQRNPDAVAVVIGISHYKNPGVPSVDYARRDASLIKNYMINIFGIDSRRVIEAYDDNASLSDFKRIFEEQLRNYIRPEKSDVLIYYSGHGVPDPESKKAYFVPYDCKPAYAKSTGYALDEFYERLSKLKTRSITVVIDACFSGSSERGMLLQNISPLYIKVENPVLALENSVVFTSSTGQQVSTLYPEKKHGLFTYYFLKGLRGDADSNKDKQITVGEMERYLTEQVPDQARYLSNREQTPQVTGRDKQRVLVRY